MPWARRNLRGTTVIARVRDDGTLDEAEDGRVDIKYKPDEEAKVYRALARNLLTTEDEASTPVAAVAAVAAGLAPAPATAPRPLARAPAPSRSATRAIIVYTDG